MINANHPILVIGLGHMGFPYVRKLIELGISHKAILGIDPDGEACARAEAEFGISAFPNFDVIGMWQPRTAIIAAPAPMHRRLLEECASVGVTHVLCEKPLVMSAAELEGLESQGLTIYVGYLINLSPAIFRLQAMMAKQELECIQFHSIWGKNWFGVNRPIGPDLEEELVHPLVAAMHIVGWKDIVHIQRRIIGTRMPFVRPELEVRGALHCLGGQKDNDTSNARFFIHVHAGRYVPCTIFSSFTFAFQRREIDLSLAVKGEIHPRFKVRLEFDLPGKIGVDDRLTIIDARSNESMYAYSFENVDKLKLQCAAFLDAARGGPPLSGLVGYDWAADVVRLIDGALEE